MSTRRLRWAVAATLLALGAVAACGGGDTAGEALELRVGYAYGYDPGDVGDRVAFGRLQEESGIAATYQELGGGRNVAIAVERGDIDVGNLALVDVAKAIDQGADLRVVLTSNTLPEFVLVGGNGIEGVTDLPGKSVAVYSLGDLTQAVATELMKQAGVDSSAVEFVAVPESANRAAALIAGEIDGAVIEYVDFLRLSSAGPGLTLLGGFEDIPSFPTSAVYVVSSAFADKNPDLVRQMVHGLLDGYEELYGADGEKLWKDEASATVLAGEDPELVGQVYDFYLGVGFWPRRAEPMTKERYDRGVRFWIDTGQVERAPSFDQVWDTSYWLGAGSS